MNLFSLEKHVHDIVHAAFWDILQDETSREPPNYDHALLLFMEMKQMLFDVIPENLVSVKQEVEETLDKDLVHQQVQNEAFDIISYATFVIDTLAKLCAPVRDEDINKLRKTTELVPLLRGVMELINLMKMDFANYELMKFKPILTAQAVAYERQKFDEFIEKNPAGLNMTKSWLQEAVNKLSSLNHSNEQKLNSGVVLTHAYLSLMELKDTYPETLLMDEHRLHGLAREFERLSFELSIITLWLNFIGKNLAEDKEFVDVVKSNISDIMDNSKSYRDATLMENVYEHLIASYEKKMGEMGTDFPGDNRLIFKGQLSALTEPDDAFRKLIMSRIRDFVMLSLSHNKLPATTSGALLPIQNKIKDITLRFARIIKHNENVHQARYYALIESFQQPDQT